MTKTVSNKEIVSKLFQKNYIYIPCKFRNNKTYLASQDELNVVRKSDLNNLQSECEILELRKSNLLENIANQDKILEEKLSKRKKINQQGKKEMLSYLDCDVTKDIKNVNKI